MRVDVYEVHVYEDMKNCHIKVQLGACHPGT